jgi:predicted O-linked N-acetylglucosamine transferase (SPINDLY family)
VLQHHGELVQLDAYLEGLRTQRYRAEDDAELGDCLEQLLYLLLFFDVDPQVGYGYAKLYDTQLREHAGAPLAPRRERRAGPIRLGFLSADLRGHVMGKMVWQEVSQHDRSRFALHFYSLSRDRDEWTQRFESIAETFVALDATSDREAAERIGDDDLDVLVDLSTHTKGARPGILALKPARVQVTHVASAGTVGLSTIDFKLTDREADVAENQRYQLETLLPIDACVYPFRRVAAASLHPFHRDGLRIPAQAVLIGAFFIPLKLSRRCLALWRAILERLPQAKVVFSPANPAFRESYVRLAAAGGIATDRLMFIPQGRDESENQARYALIDFVLDPMPYGGVNGTLEAIDMGVPVVTLVGARHSERTSWSMLAHLGATQCVARTPDEYVEIAVRLGTVTGFRDEARAAIQAGLRRSPLVDAVGHTRAVEAAYLRALSERIEG